MKKSEVPQDKSTTYGGHTKMVYAQNEAGNYETVESSGWESEEFATLMAVEELNHLTEQAKKRVQSGQSSPLEYHMYSKRLDLVSLAQATGFFQWRIKRHLQPKIFSKLNQKQLSTYADVMGISVDTLKSLPE